MDWQHVSSTATSSLIPLLAIVVVSALAARLARSGRRVAASSPALLATRLVAACALLTGLPGIQHSAWALAVPHVGFAGVALLVLPSTAALRQRWLGLMHLATLAATALLWFICVVSIAHDSP